MMKNNEAIALLVSRAIQGDTTALNHLLEAIRKDIYNLSFRMTGDPENASDATQEILLRILKSIGTFRGGSSFETWVYRVATNYLLSDLAKKSRHIPVVSLESLGPMLESGLSEPPASMDAGEREKLAAEIKVGCSLGMLQCLHKESRLVYILGEIIGINSVQGAAILGISGDNFRQKLSKARKKITGFTGQYCGLVSSQAKCSCHQAINRSVNSGFINKNKLRYAHEGEGRLLAEKLDRLVDKSRLLFATIPQYDPPSEKLDAIRQMLETAKLFPG
ncbi:RNA polymerase sigma factor [Chitinophaga vietnamensis]|uniref:RNA polymerase sigma factor n=1 Tax=Chitinophaga vietnamensis TaxID=2593957 RepID=UPI0011782007|nr:RNA polymerase sigma factor [Chitinophaga vietnamensis]